MRACEVAHHHGYEYIWIDSSCINKDSSSELSEAINSMYNWYSRAEVCYAFLSDVPHDDDVAAEGSAFRKSRWFSRGWTLQELIAPQRVLFLSSQWTTLGTKAELAGVIQEITRVDRDVLMHIESLNDKSVAQRMSWAAGRETTRVEDKAYSLLGIFGIAMPTLYGEGVQAFRRLQEEILRRFPDQSLFAWGVVGPYSQDMPTSLRIQRVVFVADPRRSLFGSSADVFKTSNKIVPSYDDTLHEFKLPPLEFTPTPYGIRTRLHLIPINRTLMSNLIYNVKWGQDGDVDGQRRWYLAVLGCGHSDHPDKLLGRVCYTTSSNSGIRLVYPGEAVVHLSSGEERQGPNMFALSPSDLDLHDPDSQARILHLPYLEQTASRPRPSLEIGRAHV